MKQFTLYPIYWVAHEHLGSEPLDCAQLPFEVVDGVTIEEVSLGEHEFEIHRKALGEDTIKVMKRVKYALVHRYNDETLVENGRLDTQKSRSEGCVRELAACLRLIRPMRQHAMLMQGNIREDGSFDIMKFDVPNLWRHEVPEVQRLWTLRTRDCEELRHFAPTFRRAMRDNVWKFRMSVLLHELGFFQSLSEQWKARFLLWASAIESVYTSSHRDHQGTRVATERIKWFLGEKTSIYAPGDLNEFEPDPNLTIGDVVDSLYVVRNFIAHGDRVPDHYMMTCSRQGLNGGVNLIEVLSEAQSFIIRTTLLRILRDGLLEHFIEATTAEAFFDANGLTNSKMRKRPKGTATQS